MRNWMKKALLVVLVFGVSWGGAVWYWRATNRMPSTEDLLLLFLVLPLAVLLAIWLGAKLLAVMAAAPAAAAATVSPAGASATPSPAGETPPLAILASALRAPHGASPEELSGALAANEARADLDPELVDDNGFPVMTARSKEAGDTGMQEEITAWMAEHGLEDIRFNAEQWRALTMGSAVAAELAAQAVGDLLPADGAATPVPMLQLMPLLPAAWQLDQRRAAGQWLRHLAVQAGWPASHSALAAELPSDARGATPVAVLARLAHHAASGDAPMVAIMVACSSHLGEESISTWSANDTLFTSSRPQGLIPGEGAAGLLLSDSRQAQALKVAPLLLLHTVDEGRRHNSADDSKKSDATLLGTLTEKVLLRSASSADTVAMIVADTGHRTSRVLELMGLASAALPQLDDSADVLRVGSASGTCGAVPFMTALALARHHAIERDAPVLCISNEDAYRRCAALIRPAASLS
jgi:hypothetical protein